MSLQKKIKEDMVAAMKAKDEVGLRSLRMLVSLFTQELTATKRTPQDELTDDEVLGLIKRSLKQRREAAAQFRDGKREDLAAKEEEEAVIFEAYLPAQLDEAAIMATVQKKMDELDVHDKSGMGKLMGAVMGELKGQADGAIVKEVIEKLLV